MSVLLLCVLWSLKSKTASPAVLQRVNVRMMMRVKTAVIFDSLKDFIWLLLKICSHINQLRASYFFIFLSSVFMSKCSAIGKYMENTYMKIFS